jgi:hypothetical protein
VRECGRNPLAASWDAICFICEELKLSMCRTRTLASLQKECDEWDFMMNNSFGWMGGGAGGGMWIWTVIGILGVVLLVVLIKKVSTK